MDRVFIGKEVSGFIAIRIVKRESKEGWITAEIEIRADVWHGKFLGDFYRGELSGLGQSLQRLHATLTGTAHLAPIEQCLDLTFTGDGKGHIVVRGKAQSDPASGNALLFRIELDQTELLDIIAGLMASEATFQLPNAAPKHQILR
jgi:hypothetical protein